jgi:hypothetical protein
VLAATRFASADLACEAAAAALACLFSLAIAPACFRLVPSEHAGRLFGRLARVTLGSAGVLALAAAALRFRRFESSIGFAADAAALVIVGIAITALRPFERARDRALREPGPGGAVDGAAALRSHALLRGIRALAFLASALLVAGAIAARDTD